MPLLKSYDLFISHAWKYGDDYKRLVDLLDNAPLFFYRNYSAPEDKPIIPYGQKTTKQELTKHLINKIQPVNAVLVISGMYYYYHDWIQMEIETAQDYSKPIIAIKPWGKSEFPPNCKM